MIGNYLLDNSVDEEERYEARKKVRQRIDALFNGAQDNTMFEMDGISSAFGPPADEMTGGAMRRYPGLPPETTPSADPNNPFPGLGPLGRAVG